MADYIDTESTFDIILLFGPTVPNKVEFLPQSYLRSEVETISTDEIYNENPHFGLRDIALKAISALKKAKQVIILDELRLQTTRKSLVEAIMKKVSCQVLLVQMIPKYGYEQVMWLRQFWYSTEEKRLMLIDEAHQKKWFDASLQNFDFQSNYVDEPKEEEGFAVEKVSFPLEVESLYKFEIPALIIQWEAAVSETDDLELQIVKLCTGWLLQHPVGRIIFICDGKKVSRGIIPSGKENSNLRRCLSQLVGKIAQPVYAVQLSMGLNSGSFNIPSEPGMLAFLQRRHLLDLHSKHTCYVYATVDHKKLAERCGIRHIKISVVLESPEKILKGHGLTAPIPAMLKSMIVKKPRSTTDTPKATIVPLFDLRYEMKDGHLSSTGLHGIEEHVFVKNVQSFCLYQDLFATHITPVDQQGSNMPNEKMNQVSETVDDREKETHGTHRSQEEGPSVTIPDWMRPKRLRRAPTLETPTISEEKSGGTGSAVGTCRPSKTVYVMSEKEMLDMARQILLETGHEDIVKRAEASKKRQAPG